jgi:hypothetical protein
MKQCPCEFGGYHIGTDDGYDISYVAGSLALDLKVNKSLVWSVGHCACVQRTSTNMQQNCLSEIKIMQTDYFRLANLDTFC